MPDRADRDAARILAQQQAVKDAQAATARRGEEIRAEQQQTPGAQS